MIGIFFAVVGVSVIGFIFWFKRIKSRQFKLEENQNIQGKFSNWAEELQKLLATGKKDTFSEQAFNYVNEFIEDTYHLGLKGKKFEKRTKMLVEKKIPQNLVELFNQTHHIREEFRFGGIVRESTELSKTLDQLKEIEKLVNNL